MKKIVALFLALALCLCLFACGNKTLTLEDLSGIYVQDEYDTRASFVFEDGTLTIEVIQYVEYSGSPTGKVAGNTETFTETYTLDGENYVIVDGTKYYYEIDEDNKTVTFSVKFMDLAEEFYFDYIR